MVREEEESSSSGATIRKIEEAIAALEALVERRSRAVRNNRLRYTTQQQLEKSETKLDGSDANAVRTDDDATAKTEAVKAAAAATTNAIVVGDNNAAGASSSSAGSDKVAVADLTSDGKERNEVCLRKEQQQNQGGATRPKLYIPSLPRPSPYDESFAYNNFRRFYDVNYYSDEDVVGMSHQLQGTKRKQPEEDEREYSPVNHLTAGTTHKTLIPLTKEKKKYELKIPLMGVREHESSIPAARENNEEHESLVPPPEEEKYELPILATEEEEHRSSSVPLEEYESLIPVAEEEGENDESLIYLIGQNFLPRSLNYKRSKFVTSLHTRRVKTLTLSPVNDKLFVTSSLDGMVRLWEVHSRRLRVELLSASMDCVSPRKGRLPEDIAWHPNGNTLFGVHSADAHDSQVSIMTLTGGNGEMREILVDFLENKPHAKGAINSIAFLPMEDQNIFVTGGSDHAVVVWRENHNNNNNNSFGDQNKWMSEAIHRTHHTGAVKGVCGLKHRQMVLSVGMDRRILGYDVATGDKLFMHKVDTKCLDVLPNPRDSNLFLVQTGTHKRQIRLFDIRVKHREIHDVGWRQQNSETQSGLINPSWSSNGMFITCGSVDPQINIFDIRYKGHKPIFVVEGHEKRVYKAVCLQSRPLLVSTSADHTFGLHRFA